MTTQPQPNARHARKHVQRPPYSDKNNPLRPLAAIIAAITAAIIAAIAASVHLLPQVNAPLPGSQLLSALGIHAVFTTPDQGTYILIAVAAFLVVSVIKFPIKYGLDPAGWWGTIVILETIFDGAYVASVYLSAYFSNLFIFLAIFIPTLALMIAIDQTTLPPDEYDLAAIITSDVIEALTFAGLTLLFLNLVVLQH